jgi:hypothetical protein
MGAVPERILKNPIASLDDEDQARITAALDFMFQEYLT